MKKLFLISAVCLLTAACHGRPLSSSTSNITGQDALYDASLYLNSHPGEQVLVIWWEKLPQEKRRFSFRNSCTSTAEANNLILHALNFGIKGDL